ncbi:MAG TPA: phytanoyl-CoA dioxygenase family protein [Planctomycetota bacterium]|nr:phytanoyl-CoA dioxygenase family protein [Planctomycetota bacterium]
MTSATAARPDSRSKPRLDAAQVAAFRREGYLTIREPVLSPTAFAGLKAHFEDMLADLPEGKRPESMDVPHFVDTTLFTWLFDDAVLDLVEPILGPDIALFSSHFICKPGTDGKRVPWHEDSAYWGDALVPMEVVTVWLAIDPSGPDNGCMRVIPGALGGYSEYEPCDTTANVFHIEIKRGKYDAAKAVDIVLEPNQASLHESHLMHGSNANTSGRRRCGYTMRYISAATRHNVTHSNHQIYLARGRDRAGNRYGDPTKSYGELAIARGLTVKKGH